MLSAAWIALVVIDLVAGPLPALLDRAVLVIWALFAVDFAVELAIAPDRRLYLRTHVLTVLSLILPAVRVLRVFRALAFLGGARAVRSVGLLRVLTSTNRGLAALGRTARRRGVGYVIAATAIVIGVGSAGMAMFESPTALVEDGVGNDSSGIADYGEAIWWTASAMTTGPPSQPRTGEGRLLGWVLSVYGLAVFGYLTATLASHFVGRDREDFDPPS